PRPAAAARVAAPPRPDAAAAMEAVGAGAGGGGAARRGPARPWGGPRACRGRFPARRRSCAPSGRDPGHVFYHLRRDLVPDLLHALGVADQQGDVAEVVDLAGGAAREIEDELDRVIGEELVRLPGHPEPVGDVARGVLVVERVQVIAEADPLVEMLEP